ncbi:MAG: glycosyltransferase [Lachnospiraceae bacterium]|nr:glycosyltransferase [Lachnospiraceae bacterium]
MSKKTLCIIIVSLNPGDKLETTLKSIFAQRFEDYTVIVKDGGSGDGSIERLKDGGMLEGRDNVHIVVSGDKGIYDGMNQAVEEMKKFTDAGYCIFMNCGDVFHDDEVLLKMEGFLKDHEEPHIIYGDQYNPAQGSVISSAPEINDFALFRNVPCHQVCFYDVRLFENRAYDTSYRVRADYEHFLYAVYKMQAKTVHVPVVICDYEGGGFSETAQNRKISAEEHRKITDIYMPKQAAGYRAVMLLTLAPLRTKMAESPVFSKTYNTVKSFLYRKKGNKQ